MGHNLTDRKARELEAAERSRLVCGWVVTKEGRVDEPQTPAGVLARGATLQARCGKRPDCGRRVTFDAALWCAAGHGSEALCEVLSAHRCGLVPCRLNWLSERYPAGRPLGTYLHDEKASVVVCCSCGELKPKRFTIRAFAKAVVTGEGPAALAWPVQPVREGAVTLPVRLVRGVCPWCREKRWRILLFPTPHRTP